ncbi:MAG TPA: PepSY domain-containing protein [Rhodanobacteraceae bacterium]|nr:PepSY domain-containing protein [Rhodanobacteraceae bacterium]
MALLCALALAFAATTAGARELSAQEAVAKVQQETSGKVLSVQTLMQGKRKVYRIKVLTSDGQVRVIQVSAEQ